MASSWQLDASRRLLCVACSASLRVGARCATTLKRWAPGDTAFHCVTCEMWSSAWSSARGGAEGGGAAVAAGGAAAGAPMPPPPPESAGGGALDADDAQAEGCGRCRGEATFLRLRL